MKYKLLNIKVNKFDFKLNEYNQSDYNINLEFGKKINKIDDNKSELILKLRIMDNEEAHTPFNIEYEMATLFEFEDLSKEEYEGFMNINAIQIAFPYMRSTLTSLTSSLMIKPVILPIIDVRTFLKNSK